MDCNNARRKREEERNTPQQGEPDAAPRLRPEGDAPQAAGGEAAVPGCPSNTRENSSQIAMKGYPDYRIAGGYDWLEWGSLTHWEDSRRFQAAMALLEEAKVTCQEKRLTQIKIYLPEFGPLRVYRTGYNRGGARGQHYEYKVQIAGAKIGIATRNISPHADERELQHKLPNFHVKQEGRDCLLVGAREAYEMEEALITALGGVSISQRLTRVDFALDIVGMCVTELSDLVEQGYFITPASKLEVRKNLITGINTGFHAGRHPLYLTVYDKVRERLGNSDELYNQALIDRRWGGAIPDYGTRVEFQVNRAKLRDLGINSPADLWKSRGSVCEYLTGKYFRLTSAPVDRKQKHQSRAEVHPLWFGIQAGFEGIFGPPEGPLVPLKREKVAPIALVAQARGCLASCLLQMGIEFKTYEEFVQWCAGLLVDTFSDKQRQEFLRKLEAKRMEYEVS